MSTRRSLVVVGRVHVFREVASGALCIDVGRRSYNRAWRIWPLPSRRVY